MDLYDDLVPWYLLLDPLEDHRQEALGYRELLQRVLASGAPTLLELGAGAGNNAFFLKAGFRCTLSDLSPGMLELSRRCCSSRPSTGSRRAQPSVPIS